MYQGVGAEDTSGTPHPGHLQVRAGNEVFTVLGKGPNNWDTFQAVFRMHRQRSRWRRLKLGFVALQRLARRRRRRRDAAASLQREEVSFQQQLERVKGRKAEMERRFKAISRLHPNKINNYLGSYK